MRHSGIPPALLLIALVAVAGCGPSSAPDLHPVLGERPAAVLGEVSGDLADSIRTMASAAGSASGSSQGTQAIRPGMVGFATGPTVNCTSPTDMS